MRLHDRHGAEFCLGPTHEEAITSLVAVHLQSHRQLPLRLYQVHIVTPAVTSEQEILPITSTSLSCEYCICLYLCMARVMCTYARMVCVMQLDRKFRDEVRPRFGLLRAREFWMKDMYTFDRDTAGALMTYSLVDRAYTAVFRALDLPFVRVEADTGQIGGTLSHEYHLLAEVGEDALVSCSSCDYASNRCPPPPPHCPAGAYALFSIVIAAQDLHWCCSPTLTLELPRQGVDGTSGRTAMPPGDTRRCGVRRPCTRAPRHRGSLRGRLLSEQMPNGCNYYLGSSIDANQPILFGYVCPAQVAHAFYLGTKYSDVLGASFTDVDGTRRSRAAPSVRLYMPLLPRLLFRGCCCVAHISLIVVCPFVTGSLTWAVTAWVCRACWRLLSRPAMTPTVSAGRSP